MMKFAPNEITKKANSMMGMDTIDSMHIIKSKEHNFTYTEHKFKIFSFRNNFALHAANQF